MMDLVTPFLYGTARGKRLEIRTDPAHIVLVSRALTDIGFQLAHYYNARGCAEFYYTRAHGEEAKIAVTTTLGCFAYLHLPLTDGSDDPNPWPRVAIVHTPGAAPGVDPSQEVAR